MPAVHAYETSRPDVARHVPANARRVLDAGCAAGALGAALKRERPGLVVVGVERDPAYAAAARAVLDDVVEGDLDAATVDGTFDVLICADVLEHLVDPWTALQRLTRALEPGGTAVVSLPNVRSWETFWQLGRHGRWPRRSVGLFDRTHLRWFTLADAHDLLTGAGLRVERVDRRLLKPDGQPWPRAVRAIGGRVPLVRTLLALQHVLVARRPG